MNEDDRVYRIPVRLDHLEKPSYRLTVTAIAAGCGCEGIRRTAYPFRDMLVCFWRRELFSVPGA